MSFKPYTEKLRRKELEFVQIRSDPDPDPDPYPEPDPDPDPSSRKRIRNTDLKLTFFKLN